jgi:hypothetical protein
MSKEHEKDALLYRSFHLTAGGLFLVLPVWIWLAQGSRSGSWPLFAWILFFILPILGAGFLLFGIIASDRKVASIGIVATPSNLVLATIAFPLYFLLRGIRRKRAEQRSHREHERGS